MAKFLPSFLDYSPIALRYKLNDVYKNLDLYLKLTNQKIPSFHIDIVAEQFAKDRKVMMSLPLEQTLTIFEESFGSTKCTQTIHLMQENEDILEVLEFLKSYKFNSNWQYQFFVGQRHYEMFKLLNNQQSSVGIWLDKYEICKLETKNYLLMSVFAGKSGQKLEPEIKTKLLKIVAQNPKKNYILDGGFEVEKNYPNLQNLQIVSYSSFWKLWELDKK